MKTENLQQKHADKKVKVVTGIVLGVTALLIVVGLSYAMLPTDNLPVEPLDVTASTATMKLRYTDCKESDTSTCADISKELNPGDSISKEFKVSNIGDSTAHYAIYFRELTNTFKHEELVYKLENLTTGEIVVPDMPVPTSLTDNLIKSPIAATAGSTIRYKLTVTFMNTDRDQLDNLNSEFSLKIAIKDVRSQTS